MGREGHHVIFPMEPLGVLKCAKQGFVTEYGFFVDREVGLYIARYYNQIDVKYNPKDKAFLPSSGVEPCAATPTNFK